MQRLTQKNRFQADDVKKIEIKMNSYEANYPGMKYAGPFHKESQCGMSTAFVLALMLLDGKAHLDDMKRFNDPAILQLCQKTKVMDDPDMSPLSCELKVVLKNERELIEEMKITPAYYFFGFEKVAQTITEIHHEMLVPQRITTGLIRKVQEIESWRDTTELLEILTL